jgi:uncharacterized protein
MSLLQETKDIQSKMALFCRTSETIDLPGLTPNRLHHYRRLVYNIILDNLESSFPIAFEYIDKEKWEAMVFDFFSHHNCQSYQVWQIPGEFYEYANRQDFASKHQLDYINDLLKFEWEEMLVYNMEDITPENYSDDGDPLKDIMVLNPEHKLLQFQYPVHLHKPVIAGKKKGNYYVLLYREQLTGKVQFIDLSPWYALVIEQLGSQEITLKTLIDEAPNLFGDIDLEDLTETTYAFISELRARDFILGFKK